MKNIIPIVDICRLTNDKQLKNDFLIDRFEDYLQHHYHSLQHPHRHNFYHLVLFTSGKGKHTIDFEQFKVRPYQIYFMTPGQVHSWNFEKDIQGFVVNFSGTFFRSFLLSPDYMERFIFFDGSAANGCFKLPEKIQSQVVAMFEDLLQIYHTVKQNNDEDWIRVALLKIFITIDNDISLKNSSIRHPLKHQILIEFRRLIEKNYQRLRLPKEYAALLHVTPNHLNILCNEILGMNAGKLIRDRLLLEAKRLLTNGDMTIAEIANELNFEDNSYFNRFFKKYEKITPNDFRKQFIHI